MFIIQYIANFVFVNTFLGAHYLLYLFYISAFIYIGRSLLEYFEKTGYLVYILKALQEYGSIRFHKGVNFGSQRF